MQSQDTLAYWLEFKKYWQRSDLFERIIERVYTFHLGPGDVAIDGGANRGRHTFPMAQAVGARGRVFAVEAIPSLADELASKVAEANVEVIPKALSNQVGIIQFNYCQELPTRSGIFARKFAQNKGVSEITVETTLIDHLTLSNRRLKFIKLDLEGGEYFALQGAIQTIESCKPLIVSEHGGIEGAELYGYENEDYYEFLRDSGYSIIDILGREITFDRFIKPEVFYFIALNLQDASHTLIREMMPTFLVAAAQEVTLKSNVRFMN